ncbi:MAG: hypothetical protein JKY56_20405 [Kofleriaceae bacterium]|nr:hypothetical protein [Kofleriaceae bacterium]
MIPMIACCGLSLMLLACGQEASAQRPPPADQSRLGASACASCHAKQYRKWKVGPHRISALPLGAGSRSKSAMANSSASKFVHSKVASDQCGACHKKGAVGVSCEDCHGAGRNYSEADIMANPGLAKSLGLRSLASSEARARYCKTCHRSETLLHQFDSESAWARIAH